MLGLSDCCNAYGQGDAHGPIIGPDGSIIDDPALQKVMDQQHGGGGGGCLGCMSSVCACGTTAKDVGGEPEARMLEPLIEERIVEVLKEEIHQKFVEVPEVQYLNKVIEVEQKVLQERIVERPVAVYRDRIREVIKPVYEEKIVPVPEVKIVDTYDDKPEIVYKERTIEVPKFIVREYEEEKQESVVREERVVQETQQYQYQERQEEVVQHDVYEKVVQVPHIQTAYRNVMQPTYRHVPKAVEVPMTHYRPIPIEKLVDRNVPVPVEIHIIQEYLCAKIEPVYKDVHVPVHVQRTIEHPVPREAMNSEHLLPLYYQGTVQENAPHFNSGQNEGNPNALCHPFPAFCGAPNDVNHQDKPPQLAPIFQGQGGPIAVDGSQTHMTNPMDPHMGMNGQQMPNIPLDPNDPQVQAIQQEMQQHMPPHLQQNYEHQSQQPLYAQ